jgi:hypothetical protein
VQTLPTALANVDVGEEFFFSLRVRLSTPPISTSTKFTKNRGGVYKKDLFSVRYSPSLFRVRGVPHETKPDIG